MDINERLNGERLKVIPLVELSAAKIAAITEHLKYSATSPTLAFFKYKKAVTLSNKQTIKDVNIDLAESQNYEIVRTLGGGRAYIHNGDISFLFVLPNYDSLFSASKNYSFISDKFISAFNKLGLNAKLMDRGKYGYDIYSNGKILLGLAQDSTMHSLMIHGAFYYNKPDYEMAVKLIKGYDSSDSIELEKKVGYVLENSCIKLEDILQQVVNSFGMDYYFASHDFEAIKKLAEKYDSLSHKSGGIQRRGMCWLPKEFPPGTFND